MEEHPVEITGRQGPSGLEVSVRNAGSRIPREDLEKLFMPFKHGAASLGWRGLDLGLYIALEIAKAHGGTIDVSSDETGTCFSFRVPTGR